MNRENNQRFKETEERIINAYGRLVFAKPIEKITVSDICKMANIHRTTFYGHFQDVTDLSTYVESREFDRLMEAFITEDGWNMRKGIQALTRFYYENRRIVRRNYMVSTADEHVNRVFSDHFESSFKEAYKKKYGCLSDTEFEYHYTYVNSGSVAIIKKWVLSGCLESPEAIADILCKIYESS